MTRDGLVDDVGNGHWFGAKQGFVRLQSGQVDDLCHEGGQPC